MTRFRVGLVLLVVLLGVVFVPGVVRDAAGQSTGSGVNVYAGLAGRSGPFVSGSAVVTRYRGAPRGSRVEARVGLYRQLRPGAWEYRLVASRVFTLRSGARRATGYVFKSCVSASRNRGWYVVVRANLMVGTRVVSVLEHRSTPSSLPCQ